LDTHPSDGSYCNDKFVAIVGNIFFNGFFDLNFLINSPESSGRSGGISTILVSTVLILTVCLFTSVPLGLATAIFLAELTSKKNLLGKMIRQSLDVLAGIPSIVFGLFGNVFFCKILNLGFSILSGGLTLACMVLPILIRTTEEGLRLAPKDYRVSAAALSLSKITVLKHLLLPAAAPSILVGLILGIGRALSETAALIFTSGYVDRMPESLMDSGRALAVHIYDLSMNISGGDRNAYKSALVLLGLVLIINSLASSIMGRWAKRRITAL